MARAASKSSSERFETVLLRPTRVNAIRPQQATSPVTRTFTAPEIGVPLRCDLHGWMGAYANVVTHPFFAVTGEDGTFELRGLPPGRYTIEVWHEEFGRQSQPTTIAEDAPAAMVVFMFKGEPPARGAAPTRP